MKKYKDISLFFMIVFFSIGCVSKNIYFESPVYPEILVENHYKTERRNPTEYDKQKFRSYKKEYEAECEQLEEDLAYAIKQYEHIKYTSGREEWADRINDLRKKIDDCKNKIEGLEYELYNVETLTKSEYKNENIDFSKIKTIYIARLYYRYSFDKQDFISLTDEYHFKTGDYKFETDEDVEYYAENIRNVTGKEVVIATSFKVYEALSPENQKESIFLLITSQEIAKKSQSSITEYCLPMITFGLYPQTYTWQSEMIAYWYNPAIKKFQLLTTVPYKEEKSKWCINFLRPWRWNDDENINEEKYNELIKAIFKK